MQSKQTSIRQAIRTRYHGPTESNGSRISAKCEARTIYIPYEDAWDSSENHFNAATELVKIMQWDKPYHGLMRGGVFDQDYYWVFIV